MRRITACGGSSELDTYVTVCYTRRPGCLETNPHRRGSNHANRPINSDRCAAAQAERGRSSRTAERVYGSSDFDASDRNHAFLRYVVEETLAGKAHLIKGYSIAQSVFKRDVDFDPQLDPVVRIEASRLRRSLERYYLKAGQNDAIRIDLPKGGYIPTFEVIDPLVIAAADPESQAPFEWPDRAPADPDVPTVAIIPFRNLDTDPSYEFFALGITEELFAALTHFSNLRVLALNTSLKLSPLTDAAQVGRTLSVGFVLQGSVRTLPRRVRITAQLAERRGWGLCLGDQLRPGTQGRGTGGDRDRDRRKDRRRSRRSIWCSHARRGAAVEARQGAGFPGL